MIKFYSTHSRNLTKKECNTLGALANEKNITFQPADKDGALMVMDAEYYGHQVTAHVNDTSTFVHMANYPTQIFHSNLQQILIKATDMERISEHTYNYLFTQFPRRPQFYMLPKVHKHQTNPPFRPIVSACGFIHDPIGRYVNFFFSTHCSTMAVIYPGHYRLSKQHHPTTHGRYGRLVALHYRHQFTIYIYSSY